MKLKVLLFSFCLFSIKAISQEKLVCISIDDLPTVSYGIQDVDFNKILTSDLIQTFKTYDIPAIGYVNEGKLFRNNALSESQLGLLEMWLSNGYELGNHTFDHLNYDQVDYEKFTQNILKGELETKKIAKKHQMPYRYFRHPYLRMGSTKEKTDSLSHFLTEHDYIIAPVTIDNEDYIFAKAYHNVYKQKNQALMDSIGTTYVQYMEAKLNYYENMSQEVFGRNMSHTLLIHASLLNSHYLNKLAEMYQKHGYKFASQEEVLKDPAYNTEISRFGTYGISWLDRWALSMGKKGDFFKNDPITPGFIVEISNQ